MKDVLISIIIPLYNAEKYIVENVRTVLNQTFKESEIIIVNDGSTDNSWQLINNSFKDEIKNKRITLINQNNFGAPSARNKGINMARGKYMVFLDADDMLKNNALEKLYEAADKNDADLVVSSITILDENNQIIKKNALATLDDIFGEKRSDYYRYSEIPLGKLYKKSIITENNIEWENLRARQDTNFHYKFLGCCNPKKVIFVNEDLALYRALPNSISHVRNLNILDLVKAYNGIEKFYIEHKLDNNIKYLNIVKVMAYTGNLANGIKHYSNRHYRKFIAYFFITEIKNIRIQKKNYNSYTYSYLNKMIAKAKIKYILSDLYYLYKKITDK